MSKASKTIVNTEWQREYQLLKNLDFVLLDNSAESDTFNQPAAFDIDYSVEDIVLIEKDIARNQFCVILRGNGDYNVYVQDDIGCGFYYIPLRWEEIEYQWFNNLYKGIRGNGFTWKPIDIGEPNMEHPYGVELSRTTLY